MFLFSLFNPSFPSIPLLKNADAQTKEKRKLINPLPIFPFTFLFLNLYFFLLLTCQITIPTTKITTGIAKIITRMTVSS